MLFFFSSLQIFVHSRRFSFIFSEHICFLIIYFVVSIVRTKTNLWTLSLIVFTGKYYRTRSLQKQIELLPIKKNKSIANSGFNTEKMSLLLIIINYTYASITKITSGPFYISNLISNITTTWIKIYYSCSAWTLF